MRRTVTALLVLSLTAAAAPHSEAIASALGQLEGLAGRSAGSVNVPMPSAPSPVGGMGAVKGLAGAASGKGMSGLNALDFGMQLLNIIDSMDAPSPAAAQQQQLQEQQQREQERLRALRQQSAEQLRSSWDNADAAHADAVDGVLDVPIRQGTAFFGTQLTPGGPLPGAAPAAQTAAQPATPSAPRAAVRQSGAYAAVQEPPQSTTEISPPHAEILAKGAEEFSRNATKDMLENALEKGIALLPNQWRAELIYEHQKKMRGFIDEIFTHLDARRLVNTIARGTPAEMAELEQEISKGTRESARKLAMSDDLLQDEEPTYALKLFKGEKVSAAETWSLIKGRVYNAGIEKTTGNLLFGGD
ncbi:hypothetical protein E4633_07140 [Geomonas terrae]|uniref:Uncharacterized protein n=1 Tax=Geomonas terrae TaxID=2562681 RepID=A0A4S1CPG8_9BACT|nr:hypothetical protein [Geomonas terrae]TGU75216.1 hypothetical protein E4633_07140 [Geomonas terrae]